MEFTQIQLLDRADKVKAIKDIYKKEWLLSKAKTDFYKLYDNKLEDLLFYDNALANHVVANMRREREHKFGISRH